MRGRSVLITGATGGLGFTIAERLLAAGARVMVNGLVDPAEMAEPLSKLMAGGGTAIYHRADLADTGAIAAMIDTVLEGNPSIVAEYRAGKQKAFNSLVGQIMKETKGSSHPALVTKILKELLA